MPLALEIFRAPNIVAHNGGIPLHLTHMREHVFDLSGRPAHLCVPGVGFNCGFDEGVVYGGAGDGPACHAHAFAGLGVQRFDPFQGWVGQAGEQAFGHQGESGLRRGPEGWGLGAVPECSGEAGVEEICLL